MVNRQATLAEILLEAVKSGVACVACQCSQCLSFLGTFFYLSHLVYLLKDVTRRRTQFVLLANAKYQKHKKIDYGIIGPLYLCFSLISIWECFWCRVHLL